MPETMIYTKNAAYQKFEVLKTNRNKRYRYQVSFRGTDSKRTRALIMTVLTAFQQSPESRTVSVTADKNPYTI